ncbi:hypothetical protein CEXT_362451 [Caerostris extrusa]|uniref:Uncharacterized protein n=1 Tax=Caerostris extrusa TaxID=172846 RepID=A0AAV4VGD7_CAEEX|nr:hypothetical protein CEXT_362451 [Caerostris extrusa]
MKERCLWRFTDNGRTLNVNCRRKIARNDGNQTPRPRGASNEQGIGIDQIDFRWLKWTPPLVSPKRT